MITLQAPSLQIIKPASPTASISGFTIVTPPAASVTTYRGQSLEKSSGGYQVWFEEFHVLPRSFDLGNVLSSQSLPIYVFLASTRRQETWNVFTNNAGAGVDLTGDPALPVVMDPFTQFAMQLEISATGDPFVDSFLVFEFSTGTTIVPISLERIVLFELRPEIPYAEVLAFLTDVIQAKSGKERRHALRKNPRQTFDYEYLVDEFDRSDFENRLFDFHARQFGVPVWFDDSDLSVAVLAGDTVVNVNSTAFRDYRVGGLAVILAANGTFDVLSLTAIGATTLTSDSPTVNAYPLGLNTQVFPLATCRLPSKLQVKRWPVNLSSMRLPFSPSNNDANLGSIAHFPTLYKGKPVIESGQIVNGTVSESFETRVSIIDSGVGLREQTSPWDGMRHGLQLELRAQGRQAGWELRRFAHWLRGKQVTFYVPRDAPDIVPKSDLLNLSTAMAIENIGYYQHVRQRMPRNSIYIKLTNGTVLMRDIVNSAASLDPTQEGLTVDIAWAGTTLLANISRISFLEKMRLDTDAVRLEFDVNAQTVRLLSPIVTVFE